MVFHIFSALAEFERDLIRDRTHVGLQVARARGKKGGRPAQLFSKDINNINKWLPTIMKVKIRLMKLQNLRYWPHQLYNYLRKEKKAIQAG